MKCGNLFLTISLLCVFGLPANASYLTAGYFPETIDDASFSERIEAAKDGYDLWIEYTEDGKCVKNCTYSGITLAESVARSQKATSVAMNTANRIKITQPVGDYGCVDYNMSVIPGQAAIVNSPVIGNVRISAPFGPRFHPVQKVWKEHKGMDLATAMNTTVYTPANGTIKSVWTDNGCGKGLQIQHAGGMVSKYCHLNDNSMYSVGQSVRAGCAVAKTGNTGMSTGPHLHYELLQNGEHVDPSNFM